MLNLPGCRDIYVRHNSENIRTTFVDRSNSADFPAASCGLVRNLEEGR